MKTDQDGLASVEDIMALAAQLSSVADAMHERALVAIRAPADAKLGDAERDAAFALLDEELLLRQHVHALYLDAARATVKGLGQSQQHVLALTADAAEKIRKVGAIANITGLVAAVVGLAGAAAGGAPGSVSLARKEIRDHIKAIKAQEDGPKKPPPRMRVRRYSAARERATLIACCARPSGRCANPLWTFPSLHHERTGTRTACAPQSRPRTAAGRAGPAR